LRNASRQNIHLFSSVWERWRNSRSNLELAIKKWARPYYKLNKFLSRKNGKKDLKLVTATV